MIAGLLPGEDHMKWLEIHIKKAEGSSIKK